MAVDFSCIQKELLGYVHLGFKQVRNFTVWYLVWGLRVEKKSPDFRSPEVGISASALSFVYFMS